MGFKDIPLEDIISIVRGRGPRFHAKVRVNIEHPEPVRDGFSVAVRPNVVADADVDLRVLFDMPGGYGKAAVPGHGGRLERIPGYAVVHDDDDDQIYLILAVPLDDWPEEIR